MLFCRLLVVGGAGEKGECGAYEDVGFDEPGFGTRRYEGGVIDAGVGGAAYGRGVLLGRWFFVDEAGWGLAGAGWTVGILDGGTLLGWRGLGRGIGSRVHVGRYGCNGLGGRGERSR